MSRSDAEGIDFTASKVVLAGIKRAFLPDNLSLRSPTENATSTFP